MDTRAAAGARHSAAVELGAILKADFNQAMSALRQPGSSAADRRTLVRCFGSLMDGLANALCTVAKIAGAVELHHARHDSAEPSAAVLQRISSSYRMISRDLPASPLASLPARRWEQLKTCLDIRNRVLHPQIPCDLDVSESNIKLIAEVAREFIRDFETVGQWQARRQPFAGNNRPGRKRHRGGRRFRACGCGSGRKYKNCCHLAAKLAA